MREKKPFAPMDDIINGLKKWGIIDDETDTVGPMDETHQKRENEHKNALGTSYAIGKLDDADARRILRYNWRKRPPNIEEEGIDKLAWYRSFHWPPSAKWGIYVLDSGLSYVSRQVLHKKVRYQDLVDPKKTDAYDRAILQDSFELLLYHEFFHYLTDMAATVLEAGNFMRPARLYVSYRQNVCQPRSSPRNLIEEALANAYALTKFFPQKRKEDKSVRDFVIDFMGHQPQGYCDYAKFRGHKFNKGKRELVTLIASAGASPIWASTEPVVPLEYLIDNTSSEFYVRHVPIYVVHDTLHKRPPTRLRNEGAKFSQSPALFEEKAYYRA